MCNNFHFLSSYFFRTSSNDEEGFAKRWRVSENRRAGVAKSEKMNRVAHRVKNRVMGGVRGGGGVHAVGSIYRSSVFVMRRRASLAINFNSTTNNTPYDYICYSPSVASCHSVRNWLGKRNILFKP